MKYILAVFRVVISYSLLFVVAMIGIVAAGDILSPGAQMAVAFIAPAVGVWFLERRRKLKRASRTNKVHTGAPTPPPLSEKHGLKGGANEYAPPESSAPWGAVNKTNTDPTERPSSNRRSEFSQDYAAIARHSREIAARRDRGQQRAPASASRRQGWVPKGETVEVGGRHLDGMIYVGTPPALSTYGYGEKSRPYIDPALPVARAGTDKAGHDMPYWPGYSGIPPRCRATYLDWLASGRSDTSYDPGYMFLYFYGLERRFFMDEPSQDERQDLVKEARRLACLYPGNRSVQRYLGEFIEIGQAGVIEAHKIEPIFENQTWELPFSLKLALGVRIREDEPLDADWVLSWLMCDPESRLRTPASRCFEEFRELFRLKFMALHPEGLKIRKPRATLKATYRAASSEFTGTVTAELGGKPVPDVSGLRQPIQQAQKIAEAAMEDLDKYSRFLGRNPDGRGTMEGHALLPLELWSLFPAAEMDALKAWAAEIVAAGGLVTAGDVVKRLEGVRPDKIGKRHLTGAADALARLGFGLAPDPRFALRSPKAEEPVVLFHLGAPVEKLEDVSAGYRSALMQLALASFVAHADGHIAEAERVALAEQARSAEGLSEQEKHRLQANVDWFLAVPPDIALLRRKLKESAEEDLAALRASIVAAAHADGVIQSEEVAGIEKLYKALGMDPGLAYSDLHAGVVPDGPRTVRPPRSGAPGEAIPDEPVTEARTLDSARIAAIRSDTERVSSVLGEIFAEDEESETVGGLATDHPFDGLDEKHAELVRTLVSQAHWSEEAFQSVCNTHGVMPAGALEAVNEWSFETYDEPLLDEFDGYDVSPDVSAAINEKLGGVTRNVQTETA
ncbi:TerB N-terminal domain-containing protein [Roseivivax marinus]|uniref:tellurite resistance TerB family protein n=1 Tax=Roseivivax marinus TaxID=1379903 RepID=UPI000B825665|nr:TerB N-terminal domain-containing protein [Roseivivax marinus]